MFISPPLTSTSHPNPEISTHPEFLVSSRKTTIFRLFEKKWRLSAIGYRQTFYIGYDYGDLTCNIHMSCYYDITKDSELAHSIFLMVLVISFHSERSEHRKKKCSFWRLSQKLQRVISQWLLGQIYSKADHSNSTALLKY